MHEILDYYRLPGQITGLDKYKEFTDWLTPDPEAIYQVAQGLLIHDMWIDKYGIDYDTRKKQFICRIFLIKPSNLRPATWS